MDMEFGHPRGGGVACCGKCIWKTVPSSAEQEKAEKQKKGARRQLLQERRRSDEIVVKASLHRHIKDLLKKKMQETIRNRIESSSVSIIKTF